MSPSAASSNGDVGSINHEDTTSVPASQEGPAGTATASQESVFAGANTTISKESPLTDIATSPPPFELELNQDVDDDDDEPKSPSPSKSTKDSYESSELSDVGEDDSEAETDKMDFLEDEEEPDGMEDKVSDLQALSNLTDLARLNQVNSDFDDEDISAEVSNIDDRALLADEIDNTNAESLSEISKILDVTPDPENIETSPSSHGTKRFSEEPEVENKKQKIEDVKEEDKPILEEDDEEVPDADEPAEEVKPDVSPEAEALLEVHNEAVSADEADVEDHTEAQKESEQEKELEELVNSDDEEKPEAEEAEQPEENGEEGEEENDDAEGEEEEGDDEEDVDLNEQRKLAIGELISIEASFAELRDKLYQDKLSIIERELQLCLEGSHPELSKIYYKINGFYQDSLKLANFNLSYNLKCIDKETIATRTSIHQDFLRKLMDSKNEMITDTTSLWYKINKERNQLDQLVPDYNYSAIPQVPNVTVAGPVDDPIASLGNGFSNGKLNYESYYNDEAVQPIAKKTIKQNTIIELVQYRNRINQQLGVLNGLVEFHGFPAAINASLQDSSIISSSELLLRKATDEEINDDLQAMGISI